MWWTRLHARCPTATTRAAVRILERVISPSESHSDVPFRILKMAPSANTTPSIEPVAGNDYRLKRNKPDRLKQCF